jgi:hypothetical protein
MIDPDELLFQQVLRKLQQEDLTASEIEVCRKYLNDRASRGGSIHTRGHQTPEEATKSDWAGLKFEDVRVVKRHE